MGNRSVKPALYKLLGYLSIFGIWLVIVFAAYTLITYDFIIAKLFGVAFSILALAMPFFFAGKENRLTGILYWLFRFVIYSIAILMVAGFIGGLWLMVLSDDDLSVDLGILVIKSGFVKILLLILNISILYYIYTQVRDFFQRRGNSKNTQDKGI